MEVRYEPGVSQLEDGSVSIFLLRCFGEWNEERGDVPNLGSRDISFCQFFVQERDRVHVCEDWAILIQNRLLSVVPGDQDLIGLFFLKC